MSNYYKAVNRPGHHIPIWKDSSLSVVIYVFDLCTCGFVLFSGVIYVFHLCPCAFFTSTRKSCALGTASLCGISQVPCHSLHEQFGNRIPLEEGFFMNLKGIFDIIRVAPPLTSFLLIQSLQLFWTLRTSAYGKPQYSAMQILWESNSVKLSENFQFKHCGTHSWKLFIMFLLLCLCSANMMKVAGNVQVLQWW